MATTDESRLRESLEEQLRFEKLVAAVSSRFINVESAEIDAEIEQVLGLMGDALGGERAYLFLLNEDGTHHHVTHMWLAPNVDPDPEVVGTVIQESFPFLARKMLGQEDIVVGDAAEEFREASEPERQYVASRGLKSFLMCPMYCRELVVGNVGLDMITRHRTWNTEDLRRLRLVGEIIANAIVRTRKDREIRELKEKLEAENVYLREEFQLKYSHDEIVGESEPIRAALREAERAGPTDTIVLLQGETGTGKELFANAIHRMSRRSRKPMISVNCAALATTLIESELFGREKGAYTGALSRQVGRFELADDSTIFLDEVGELPGEVQAKLLRILQSGEFERIGSTTTRKADARVIAATNRNLTRAVADGSFRSDLYYRLNVYPISIPPLRDRPEDIPLLAWSFVREFERSMGRRIDGISDADMKALQSYPWPGNVRELRNVVERAMIRDPSPRIHIRPPESGTVAVSRHATLEEVERRHILAVLEETGWRVRGAGGAAEALGLKPTTLDSRMQRLGIRRKD